MSSIIDYTYFKGDINIPNVAPGKEGANNLDLHINTYESEFLTEFFGYRMYADLLSNISSNPASGIWFDLWKGADFVDSNGLANYWTGLVGDTIGENYKFSPIANYVYWHRMRQRSSQTVGIGEVVSLSENSMPISPADKMVRAWNKMVQWNWILHDFILNNKEDYPNYIGLKFPPLSNPRIGAALNGNQRLFITQNTFGL